MPERGGGVVEIVRGEDQRGRSGADSPPERLEARAGSRRQPCEIDGDGSREPSESGRKAALRMLERGSGERRACGRAISRSEEPGQRRFELRGRIAFTLGREEQVRPSRLALPTAQEPSAPVPQSEPGAVLRQRRVPGRGEQLRQIRGIGLGTLSGKGESRGGKCEGEKGGVGRMHARKSKGVFADSPRPRHEPNRSSGTRASYPRAAP